MVVGAHGDGGVLLTGPDGFVGRNLRRLYAEQEVPVVLVRRTLGPIRRSESQLAYRDLTTIEDAAGVLRNVSQVVHLAGLAHRNDRVEAWRFWNDNVVLTESLLSLLVGSRFDGQFFYASSAMIYGATGLGIVESDPCRPVDACGLSKLAATQAVDRASGQGLAATSLVLPLVYGPEPGGNLAMLERIRDRGIPVPLVVPSAIRSFLWVENLFRFLIRSIRQPAALPIRMNLSDPYPMEANDFVRSFVGRAGTRFIPVPRAVTAALAACIPSMRPRIRTLSSDFTLDSSLLRNVYPDLEMVSTDAALRFVLDV